MSERKQSHGVCAYCGRELSKGGMSKHLHTCPQRQAAIAAAAAKPGRNGTLYQLQILDNTPDFYSIAELFADDYWLHLEIKGGATLEDLDDYLRAIWLECCGHLSAFTIDEEYYVSEVYDYGDKSMTTPVRRVFRPGMTIAYEYDFGTTSELVIKVVGEREGKATTEHPIALLARNTFTPPPCSICGQPATAICVECVSETQDGSPVFCGEHAGKHEHEGMLMPIVNSPRTGLCGYDGPAESPY